MQITNEQFVCHRNSNVDLGKSGFFLSMLTETRNISIYKQVLDYLTSGNLEWDVGNPTVS